MQNNTQQINKANEVLQGLAVNVTTEDRKEAITKFGVHEITIRRYLKGLGTDLDRATELIQFFKRKIAQRKKIITT